MRFISLALLALLLYLGAAFGADPCRFLVIADNWGRPGVTDLITPPPAYTRVIQEANLLQPELVIFVGDMIRGYSDAATVEQQWDAFEAVTRGFEMPVYFVVGNHDVFSKESEQIYQQRCGKLWYSFDAKDCHFLLLDSEDQSAPGRIAGPQLAWLQADLLAAKGKRLFVFIHNPIWGAKPDDFARSEWGQTIHPLLAAAGVDTVFAGHLHQYAMQPTRDGVRYLTGCGVCAEMADTALNGRFIHYLLVTAPTDGPARLAVIRPGAIGPADIVTAEQAQLVTQFDRQFRTTPIVVEDRPLARATSWTVTNPFPEAVRGAASFAAAPGWTASPPSCAFSLAPGETTTLDFSLTVDPALAEGSIPYTVEYELQRRGAGRAGDSVRLTRTVVAPLRRDIKLDGSLSEWSGEPPMRLCRANQMWDEQCVWEGPDSFSAQAWVARDRRHLYLAVKVTDKSVTPTPAGASSAAGDSVTLYLDGRPKALLGRREYAAGVGLMVVTPGDPVCVLSPSNKSHGYNGVCAASQLTPDGYALEISVPLSEFPLHRDVMGLDLCVKDTSNPKGEVYLFWHGDATNWRDASLFGRVRLR